GVRTGALPMWAAVGRGGSGRGRVRVGRGRRHRAPIRYPRARSRKRRRRTGVVLAWAWLLWWSPCGRRVPVRPFLHRESDQGIVEEVFEVPPCAGQEFAPA